METKILSKEFFIDKFSIQPIPKSANLDLLIQNKLFCDFSLPPLAHQDDIPLNNSIQTKFPSKNFEKISIDTSIFHELNLQYNLKDEDKHWYYFENQDTILGPLNTNQIKELINSSTSLNKAMIYSSLINLQGKEFKITESLPPTDKFYSIDMFRNKHFNVNIFSKEEKKIEEKINLKDEKMNIKESKKGESKDKLKEVNTKNEQSDIVINKGTENNDEEEFNLISKNKSLKKNKKVFEILQKADDNHPQNYKKEENSLEEKKAPIDLNSKNDSNLQQSNLQSSNQETIQEEKLAKGILMGDNEDDNDEFKVISKSKKNKIKKEIERDDFEVTNIPVPVDSISKDVKKIAAKKEIKEEKVIKDVNEDFNIVSSASKKKQKKKKKINQKDLVHQEKVTEEEIKSKKTSDLKNIEEKVEYKVQSIDEIKKNKSIKEEVENSIIIRNLY